MIKYRYALDIRENLIDILNLERSTLDKSVKFFSIDFKQELIPRLGEIRAKHFSHKSDVTISGSNETYLHALGKKVFFEEYSKCLINKTSYNIRYYTRKYCNRLQNEFNTICELEPESKIFDLTKYYKEIIIEKKNGEFIPDLLLRNPNTKQIIYIEIAVTHNSSDKKKNSGHRIIEFSIKEENDIQQMIDFGKNGYSEIADYYNFKQKKEIGAFCTKGNCIQEFNFFSILENGKCNLVILKENEIPLAIEKYKKNSIWNLIESYDYKFFEQIYSAKKIHSDLFFNYIARAYTQRKNVRNCYICRYHARNSSWEYRTKNPIFCKFQKIECHSDEAITCKYYRIEKSYINEYLKPLYTD